MSTETSASHRSDVPSLTTGPTRTSREPPAAANEAGGPPRQWPDPWFWLSCGLIAATNVLLLTHTRVPVVGPVVGWWLIVVYPTYLIATTRVWGRVSGPERVVYSLGATLLALVVGGLVLDLALPALGMAHPLTLIPILVMVDVIAVVLMGWRISRGADRGFWPSALRSTGRRERRVLVVSATCVPLVVLGANRLNNGAGDVVTLIGLSGVVVAFTLLYWWRASLRDWVVSVAIYPLGLSLLLATSLRGWYVTGHDIQREYTVFQLTKDHGLWSIDSFRDAYNACLSITILPTEVWQLVRVDDPYIYKLFFQLLFAACPIMVYLLARRYWSQQVAILAVVYFVGFPTFFTDMPFLNRQEIGFVFLGLAYLALTRRQWSRGRRRRIVIVCGLGIGLCHYSTIYVFIGTLAIAWILELLFHAFARLRRPKRLPRHATQSAWSDTTRIVTPLVIVTLALVAYLWGGVYSHTTSSVTATVEEALPAVFGTQGGTHSVDSSYGLFFGGGPTPQQLLGQYQTQSLSYRQSADLGPYLPLSAVRPYPTPVVTPASLPPTRLGRLLGDVHIPVSTVNDLVRGAAAQGEQVFILVGLVVLGIVRWRRRQFGRDFFFLSLASVVMVGAITVLPGLSVSYGLLRAFQQALFLVAPVLVSGTFFVFYALGRAWAGRLAGAVALVFLFSTIGVMPQLLGGYPAQLSLNNSGFYYSEYFVHPQEVAALDWLGDQPHILPAGVQADDTSDRYAFKNPSDISGEQLITDVYPTLLRTSTWTLLGYSSVHTGLAWFVQDGDFVAYRYPMPVLNDNKDLVYNNGGTRIYK